MKLKVVLSFYFFLIFSFSICYGETLNFESHTLKSGFGDIEIKNVKMEVKFVSDLRGKAYGTHEHYLFADVTNKTTKFIKGLEIWYYIYDKSGQLIKRRYAEEDYFEVYLHNLLPGETKTHRSYQPIITYTKEEKIANIKFIRYKPSFFVTYRLSMEKPLRNKDSKFEDENLSIQFEIGIEQKSITFYLSNKSFDPIEIDWNKVSYVDSTKKSFKVIHSGIKYIDIEKEQVPTVIPPTAHIDDLIIPAKYIHYSDILEEWVIPELLPYAPESEKFIGKNLGIFMPMKIGDKTINYFFLLKIEETIY